MYVSPYLATCRVSLEGGVCACKCVTLSGDLPVSLIDGRGVCTYILFLSLYLDALYFFFTEAKRPAKLRCRRKRYRNYNKSERERSLGTKALM